MIRDQTLYIVVHCSATPPVLDIGAREIDRWHRERGWQGIGYHAVIRRDGRVERGRSFDAVGAHVRGFNKVSVGVCMVGGVNRAGEPRNNFTDSQFSALRGLLFGLSYMYPDADIVGHRDMSPDVNSDGVIEEWEWVKACPCFDAGEWWLENRP